MEQNLNQELKPRLLQKTFSIMGGHDKYVWKFNRSGDYSVKTAYHILMSENATAATQGMPNKGWRTFWSLPIPYKIIVFFWKISTNYLLVKAEIHRRINEVTSYCPLYCTEKETLEHLFFLCPFARAI